MLKHARVLVATSNNESLAYQRFAIEKNKIFQLSHGVDKDEFRTTASKSASRIALNLKPNQIIITYLGRIHKIKGLELLVKAVALLHHPRFQVVIAGTDDGFLSELKKHIKHYQLKNKITLMGACFGETKARLFKATDIFVYPSYSEGFSLGILEAMAAGLPVIITSGCHFELVKTAGAGLVINPDHQELRVALETLMSNDRQRQIMSRQAGLLIDRYYSMTKIGHDLLNLYGKLAKKKL